LDGRGRIADRATENHLELRLVAGIRTDIFVAKLALTLLTTRNLGLIHRHVDIFVNKLNFATYDMRRVQRKTLEYHQL